LLSSSVGRPRPRARAVRSNLKDDVSLFRNTRYLTPALLAAGASVALAGCGSSTGGVGSAAAISASPPTTPASTPASTSATPSPTYAKGDAKLVDCGTAKLGIPAATVRLTNRSAADARYEVVVGFYSKSGKHLFDGARFDTPVKAGASGSFTVVASPSNPDAKLPTTVSCRISSVTRTGA
jgi:hypothetical protein